MQTGCSFLVCFIFSLQDFSPESVSSPGKAHRFHWISPASPTWKGLAGAGPDQDPGGAGAFPGMKQSPTILTVLGDLLCLFFKSETLNWGHHQKKKKSQQPAQL